MPANGRPIIIKRKKVHGHGGHHGGAWKVAYADFVTAMMAFFLVMWILGLSESTRRAISGYFKEPGVFEFTQGRSLPVEPPTGETSITPQGGGSQDNRRPSRPVFLRAAMIRMAARFRGKLEQLAAASDALTRLSEHVSMEMTPEGLRIELSESPDLPFFELGGSEPNMVTRKVLAALAPELAQIGNLLAIEGHTDRRPYGAGARYSNWELSSDRAHAARKVLIEKGVDDTQIGAVSGFADRRPLDPERPYDVVNRRVSIVVLLPEDEEELGQEGSGDGKVQSEEELAREWERATGAPARPAAQEREHRAVDSEPERGGHGAGSGYDTHSREATGEHHGVEGDEAHRGGDGAGGHRRTQGGDHTAEERRGPFIIVPISESEREGAYRAR